jgi:hypothetical protein
MRWKERKGPGMRIVSDAGGDEVRGLSGTADGEAAWAVNPEESNEQRLRVTQATTGETETRRTFIARHLTTTNGVDYGRMRKIANNNKIKQVRYRRSTGSSETFV